MSDEQDRENLNLAMGKLIDQWREFENQEQLNLIHDRLATPEFVAYVERYGGYTDGSAKDKPLRKLATPDYKLEIEDYLNAMVAVGILMGELNLDLDDQMQKDAVKLSHTKLTHLIETEKKKALSKFGLENGVKYDVKKSDKVIVITKSAAQSEELQGEVG